MDDWSAQPEFAIEEAVAVRQSQFGGSGVFALHDFQSGDGAACHMCTVPEI